jgi:hypothetical protein
MSDPETMHELRRMLSGYSHRCRNSLNGLKMSLYLFRREAGQGIPSLWDDLERTYRRIESLFDHLQAIYRPMTVTTIRSSLGLLIKERAPKWQSGFQAVGQALELVPPTEEALGDFDPIQLGMGLDALASWRAESAEMGTQTRIAWGCRDGSFELEWQDRSEGEPSSSGRPDDSGPDPASPPRSLVVPLLARIVEAHGGRLESADGPRLHLKLGWPQFQPAS